jgi:hypothetical protein
MTTQGIETAVGKAINKTAPRTLVTASDAPAGLALASTKAGWPVLLKLDVRCIMVQLAYVESNNDYTLENNGRLGKYQFTPTLLQKYGYIDEDNNWLAKQEINSQEEFLSSGGLQDLIMQEFMQETYNFLCLFNAIRLTDDKLTAAGMLAVAYQFQDLPSPARQALTWRNTSLPTDSQGRPGYFYYNYGRYAVQTLNV